MMKDDILRELEAVCRAQFPKYTGAIAGSTRRDDIPDWDSLRHLELFMAIERKFNIRFTMDEVVRLVSVGEIADCALSKRLNISAQADPA
jgi:acyl carrier protein